MFNLFLGHTTWHHYRVQTNDVSFTRIAIIERNPGKKILGHNKWQVSPALFVLQRPLTPEIFYCMKVKYCVASIFIIYPDLSQWHGTAHRIIKPFHLMYLKGGGVALPSLSLSDLNEYWP